MVGLETIAILVDRAVLSLAMVATVPLPVLNGALPAITEARMEVPIQTVIMLPLPAITADIRLDQTVIDIPVMALEQ